MQRQRVQAVLILVSLLALALGGCRVTITPPGNHAVTPTSTATMGSSAQTCIHNGQPHSGFSPEQLRAAYGVSPLTAKGYTGKGQTVVVIDSFGSPTLAQDLATFSAYYCLPKANLQVLAPLGTKAFDPSDHDMTGWAEETTLDVEIIHAVAPDAAIVVLTSPVSETEGIIGLPEFRQLAQYAVDHHLGSVVSQSWGASEVTLTDAAGQAEIAKWTAFYQQATTQQGVTFTTGSGDNGATDYQDLSATVLSQTATTSFPADEPWVLAAGGTSLHMNGSSVPGYTETAWCNSDGGCSGGGFSRFFGEPDFQKNLPAVAQRLLTGRRGVPDVASDGDPFTGMAIYSSGGGWSQGGGTSAAAPLWAALVAIADQMAGRPLGYINPALYKLAASGAYASDFRDVTQGNNTVTAGNVVVHGYEATAGWDPVTGLGTPIAEKLLPDLIAAIGQ